MSVDIVAGEAGGEIGTAAFFTAFFSTICFGPDQIVWNYENLSAQPPWGDKIATRIRDLSNYFVTSGGKDLIDLLVTTFEYSEAHDVPVEVR
jgi:hypothetical protein